MTLFVQGLKVRVRGSGQIYGDTQALHGILEHAGLKIWDLGLTTANPQALGVLRMWDVEFGVGRGFMLLLLGRRGIWSWNLCGQELLLRTLCQW